MTAILFVAMPLMMQWFMAPFFRSAGKILADHPDLARSGDAIAYSDISEEVALPANFFVDLVTAVASMVGIYIALISASVVRRLHDGGRSAIWGMVPLVLLVFGLAGMRYLFAGIGTGADLHPGVFALMFCNNVVYLASLAVLFFQLVRISDPHDNHYGRAPDAERELP